MLDLADEQLAMPFLLREARQEIAIDDREPDDQPRRERKQRDIGNLVQAQRLEFKVGRRERPPHHDHRQRDGEDARKRSARQRGQQDRGKVRGREVSGRPASRIPRGLRLQGRHKRRRVPRHATGPAGERHPRNAKTNSSKTASPPTPAHELYMANSCRAMRLRRSPDSAASCARNQCDCCALFASCDPSQAGARYCPVAGIYRAHHRQRTFGSRRR